MVNALDTFAFGLTNLKEYSDALVLFNKVIDLAPNHTEIAEHFTNRGKCKLNLGDKKGAKIDFEIALKKDKDFEEAKKYLND